MRVVWLGADRSGGLGADGFAGDLGEDAAVVAVGCGAVEQDALESCGGGVGGDGGDLVAEVVGDGLGDAVDFDASVGGDLDVQAGDDLGEVRRHGVAPA